jgi:hypothetical protein
LPYDASSLWINVAMLVAINVWRTVEDKFLLRDGLARFFHIHVITNFFVTMFF